MATGKGTHNLVENTAGQASLDGRGGTGPVSVMSVPVLVISNDKLDASNEKRAP